MNVVTVAHASLSLGGKTIFEDLNLQVDAGERIGLIGPNGSGKTTLLRVLAGRMQADGGLVRFGRDMRVGYLPQTMELPGGQSLMNFMRHSVPQRAALEARMETVQRHLEHPEQDDEAGDLPYEERVMQLAEEVADLHDTLADFERRYSDFQARRLLHGLGFQETDEDRDLGEFSGGWRMRGVLASLLFQQPELLLLDEPTNHLDMPSVAWLSGFLQQYKGAFLLISHDREFLNEHIRRVLSFEPEGLRSYPGNYDQYERLRDEEAVLLEQRAANIVKERERLEVFIDRFRAKASKASAVQSRVRALEKIAPVQTLGRHRRMRFSFPPSKRSGRDVLRIDAVNKAFGDNRVLDNVSLRVERGQRICLVGVNGAGKTTLLRILAGEMAADSGKVEQGHEVKLGYYAQHHGDILKADATVYDQVAERAVQAGTTQLRAILGALLLGEDDIHKPIRVLSGGERARVALARLLVDPGNLLLMDEPTNHLDLSSSEALGESLAGYDGTLLFVSHNRAFIRRLATQIWHADGGRVEVYPGTFDEFMASSRQRLDLREAGLNGKSGGKSTRPPTAEAKEPRPAHNGKPAKSGNRGATPQPSLTALQRQAEQLATRIAALEALQLERGEQLGIAPTQDTAAQHSALLQAYERDANELEKCTASWLELQESIEQAQSG